MLTRLVLLLLLLLLFLQALNTHGKTERSHQGKVKVYATHEQWRK
jgi:hypothetical protein